MDKFQYTTARWTFQTLILRVLLTPKGVLAIEWVKKEIPGQLCLWLDVEEVLPDLESVEPFGKELANDLAQVFAGKPVSPRVPWVVPGTPWFKDFYQYLFRFSPGQETELPSTVSFNGQAYNLRAMQTALRKCHLVPLVPLHRVRFPGRKPLRFGLGRYWREYLLRQEHVYINSVM